ncbi:MAG: hypothetical protein EBX53_05790 [Betaproteobacteria bacterium]|nr:hypothetical protein [Betaproteobacteria bacterium]
MTRANIAAVHGSNARRSGLLRLHREHVSKTDVRIIDFVDTGHSALLRMWDKRQRGYRAMGYLVKAQRDLGEVSEICAGTMA